MSLDWPLGVVLITFMRVTIEIPDELAKQLEPEREPVAEIIRRGLRHRKPDGSSAADEVFTFLARQPSPSEIVAFRPSETSVERLRELLDRNRESVLTSEEEAELDTLETLNDLFALVKLQARRQLGDASM